ncbi:MAG: MarC family protein [Bacteroidetes bacterium]|jgi:multiple antibiotic resistance protein|nr:MarC family protein [Bacteroidota bacterium]MBK9300140.1 MarC family protein [Bacteroidota bacterium]MBK9483073.1 MarC family protein [Bacteroidota bacterium]
MFDLNIDNISFKEIVSASFALFAVIDILGSIPILISLKNKMGIISAYRATLVSGALMLIFLFVGKYFLEILGLDIKSFAVAGSIVLFILGLEMVLGWDFFKGDNNHKVGSIVPIAFPIIAGSGTLTTIMSIKSLFHHYNILIAILINLILIYIALKSLTWIEKILGPSGLLVIRKFFGIILIAISVKMFKTNISF